MWVTVTIAPGTFTGALAGVRVLLIEDDRSLAEQLVRGLARAGCTVAAVRTGAAALRTEPPDVVLLDLGLPDIDGVELCGKLRARTGAPIIVVTARDAELDRVRGLDAGADDYVCKPFGFAELLARIRAVLRRADAGAGGVVQRGSLVVDLPGRRVTVAGQPVALTGKEFDILACLAIDPNRVVSREEIFDRVWDEHWYGPTKVLDVHLTALRRKLGDASLIETVYGRGFRLRSP